MDPVVHFEMPYDDPKRIARFYESVFGWKTKMHMENYVLASTTETGDKGPKRSGAINGGFYKREKATEHCALLIIAVKDLDESMEKVKAAGGKMVNQPVDIPEVGKYVEFTDTEGNHVEMLEPIPGSWHSTEKEKETEKVMAKSRK